MRVCEGVTEGARDTRELMAWKLQTTRVKSMEMLLLSETWHPHYVSKNTESPPHVGLLYFWLHIKHEQKSITCL